MAARLPDGMLRAESPVDALEERVMGRICSWCGAFLTLTTGTRAQVSHVLCSGCLEELQSELAAKGLEMPHEEWDAAC
jgi:hypothetical protein